MKTNKKEELQSRREFFKSAAKAALPVIGAVVLSQFPITKAEAATGCSYMTCASGCMSSCKGSCAYSSCKGSCSGSCSGYSK